jgi:hypothetical protein
MKKVVLFFCLLLVSTSLFSQVDSTNTATDDEMNIFLLVFAVVAISIILGAAIVGAFAATLLLLLATMFVSLGILSVSVLIGFYKQSVKVAFKTFLYLVSALIGMAIGASGFYLIARLFNLDSSGKTSLISGLLCGLIGGLLMAYIILIVIKLMAGHFKKKFQSP